jgi:AcrR family transcriptional regulator
MIGDHSRHDIRARVIEAALAVLGHEGCAALDTVALAKATGLPQFIVARFFPSRESLMLAVLLNLVACFLEARKLNTADADPAGGHAVSDDLALCREACLLPQKTLLSLLRFVANNDDILEFACASETRTVEHVMAQSPQPEMELIRLYAGRGLAISHAFGVCPLSRDMHDALLDRLSDDTWWRNLTPRAAGIAI